MTRCLSIGKPKSVTTLLTQCWIRFIITFTVSNLINALLAIIEQQFASLTLVTCVLVTRYGVIISTSLATTHRPVLTIDTLFSV